MLILNLFFILVIKRPIDNNLKFILNIDTHFIYNSYFSLKLNKRFKLDCAHKQ